MSTPSPSHSCTCRAPRRRCRRGGRPGRSRGRRRRAPPAARARAAARSGARGRARPRRTARRDPSVRHIVAGSRPMLAQASSSTQPFAVGVGRPHPARVPAVGVLRREPQQPVALAADEHAGRGCCTAGGWFVAPRAVVRTVVRERTAAEQTLHDLERVDEPVEPHAGPRHLHAERLVLRFVPARAQPDVEPAAAHAVDRRQRLGEHGRAAAPRARRACRAALAAPGARAPRA